MKIKNEYDVKKCQEHEIRHFEKAFCFILCCWKIWRLDSTKKKKLNVHVMRELDLFLFVQGYAKYHQQRGTVKFRAFFVSDWREYFFYKFK